MDNMIKDRGNIKWRGMMLTEHVHLLREWEQENEMVECPELEEWELTLIQEEIEIAYKSKCQTRLKTWVEGEMNWHRGIIGELDIYSRVIKLQDPFGIQLIPVAEIVSVNRLD